MTTPEAPPVVVHGLPGWLLDRADEVRRDPSADDPYWRGYLDGLLVVLHEHALQGAWRDRDDVPSLRVDVHRLRPWVADVLAHPAPPTRATTVDRLPRTAPREDVVNEARRAALHASRTVVWQWADRLGFPGCTCPTGSKFSDWGCQWHGDRPLIPYVDSMGGAPWL